MKSPQHILFSIAVPAYKETFLQECIDSVLSQSYPYFELIIVNDASPFDLDSIIDKYEDSRIRYYKNYENCGAINVVDNWNRCLEYAKGDYFICIGDDDRLLTNCLDEYVDLINRYPGLGVYHMLTELIDEESQLYNMQQSRPEYETAYSLAWHRWNGRDKQFIGDFCYDVSLLRISGGFYKLPLAWGTDVISAIRASKKTGVANSQVIGFQYRVNSQSITKSGEVHNKLNAINKSKTWFEEFLKEEPTNDLDRKYAILLRRNLQQYIKRELVYAIS